MYFKSLLLVFAFSFAYLYADTKLLILGSGTPNPDPERSGSAYAIVTNGQSYLVDFGPGVIRRASAFSPSWGGEFESMEIQNLNYAFLTHLHSDHSAGLADLILSPWVLERKEPLNLFGPRGLKRMADKITEAYQIDIDYRINGSQPSNLEGYKTKVTEIAEGIIYEDKYISVEAFENNHGDFKNSFGFVFTTKDKKIVISGDTAYSQKVIDKSKEVDILVHEVYSEKGFKEKTRDWQIYHKAHHTSPEELSQIANKIKPKVLVLSHVLFWGSDSDEIINEIKDKYSGRVILPNDGELID